MYIIRGRANLVALTLNEKRTQDDSEFIVIFINDATGQKKVVGLTDLSDQKERANKFSITESDTENLPHSVVKLHPAGQWTYTVYEMETSSPRNLDPDDALQIVETNMALVYDPDNHEVKTFSEEDTKDTPTFNEP